MSKYTYRKLSRSMSTSIRIILKTSNVPLCTDSLDITYPSRSWCNVTSLVYHVSVVFTQQNRMGGIKGKWELLFLRPPVMR
jgi:hypothetical protein